MNELSLDLSINSKEKKISIENKVYNWVENRMSIEDNEGPEGLFVTGTSNVFLWTKGDNFGYKIFSRGNRGGPRRIYRSVWSERKRPTANSYLGLTKDMVKLLSLAHKRLFLLGLAPEPLALINFNNGEFYGIKVKRIKGRLPNPNCDKDMLRLNEQYQKVLRSMRDLGLCKKNTRYKDNSNWQNFIVSNDDKLTFIDLEYRHILGIEDYASFVSSLEDRI